MQKELDQIPSVVACHMVSGRFDFLVEAAVADIAAYGNLLLNRIQALPCVV